MPNGFQSGRQSGISASIWSVFALLTLLWAGAYTLTRIAVGKGAEAGLPPEWILPGRLTIGACVLWILMRLAGQSLPALSDRRRWASLAGMGLIGSLLPFFLITSAQESVDSGLAALYAAISPVFVAIGASFLFPDERMTANTAAGVAMGFAGVLVLFGPDALSSFGSAGVTAQFLLLLAAFLYGSSTLLARSAPAMHPISFAAGYATISALLSWPMIWLVQPASIDADWSQWAAVIALGLGPSGIAQVLFMLLVARAGATFLSLTGYSIPLVSALLGWIFFREIPGWNVLLAFALILGGVWLARRRRG